MTTPGNLPPAAAMVSSHLPRTAVALPIIWHAVTLARSWHQRRAEAPFWLLLDVVGTTWSLLPVGKGIVTSRPARSLLSTILRML